MKILIGDMELSFSELISYVNYINESNENFYKKIGEITAYINSLSIFGIIDKQQIEKMYSVLDDIDELRKKEIKNKTNYCPNCGNKKNI